MKTLLVLTLLVALVGLGVWNSPKAETRPVGSVVDSVYITGSVLDGRVLSNAVVDEAVPFVYGAKLSDFKTQEQIETSGVEFQNLAPTSADDFSDHSPLPDEAEIAIYETGDGRSAELEVTK